MHHMHASAKCIRRRKNARCTPDLGFKLAL
jgi:hypothetical protein